MVGKEVPVDVSVVIPTHDAVRFLANAVVSACLQKGLAVEVLVVDDGSRDGSVALLRTLENEFPQLRVIVLEKNVGQAEARNIGIRASRGEWIHCLDSDDFYWSSTSLRDVLKSAEGTSHDVVRFGFVKLPRLGKPVTVVPLAHQASLWTYLLKKSFLEREGIFFDPDTPQREDRLFSLTVLARSDGVKIHNEPVVVKVARPGSTMKKAPDGEQLGYFILQLESIVKLCRSGGLDYSVRIAFFVVLASRLRSYWKSAIQKLGGERSPESLSNLSRLMEALGQILATDAALLTSSTPLGERANHATADVLRLACEAGDLESFLAIMSASPPSRRALDKYAVESNFSWAARSVEEYRVLVGDSVQLEQAKGGVELEQTFTKVVLHIGFPKTGTSSLQRWLENNRTNLLDQGVWYPASFVGRGSGYREGRTSGHSPVIRLLSSPLTRRFAVRRIAQEAAALGRSAHTLLLSSEMILSDHFWTSHKRKSRSHIMTRLRKALKVENTEVLLVVRPPLEWVQRYSKERASNHTLRRSPDFFSVAKRLKRLGVTDVAGILSFLEETFPRGSVRAASYSQVLQKGGLVEFVAETLDLDMSSLTDPGHIRDNVSLSDGQVDAIRQMARLRMSRRQRNRIYLEILESDELKQARFELNRPDEIDKVSRLLDKEVIAFDKLFPGASEGTGEEAGESGDVYFPRLEGFKHRLLLFPNAWVQPRLVSKILKPVRRIAFSKLRPTYGKVKVGTQRLALWAHQHFYVEKVLARRIVSGSWDFGGRRGAALRRLGKSSATE